MYNLQESTLTGGQKKMKIKIIFILFLILSILSGCITFSVQHPPIQGRKIESSAEKYDKYLFIGGKKVCKDPTSNSPFGFLVLIEEKANNVWVIKKISQRPIKRENLQQEILYVDDYFIETCYESFVIAKGPAFDCLIRSDKRSTYNPCNSKLTSTVGLGVVNIDARKIADIVKQTNLIDKVEEEKQKCKELRSAVENFVKSKITIEPIIVDKSGFYKGEELISVYKDYYNYKDEKKSNLLRCPFDLTEIDYTILIISRLGSPYSIKIDPPSYKLKHNSEGYVLRPTVTVNGKTFENVFPRYVNEDAYLRLEFDGKNINFTNKSDKFLQIKSISTYYNDEITSIALEKDIELPPQSTIKRQLSIFEIASDRIVRLARYQNVTKDSALQQNISFGFAVKYRIVEQHIDKTLYKLHKYNLYDVLSNL